MPSHEHIYQYIYADKQAGGRLHQHLRAQKTYKKCKLNGQDRRRQPVNRANKSERLGDFEGDR